MVRVFCAGKHSQNAERSAGSNVARSCKTVATTKQVPDAESAARSCGSDVARMRKLWKRLTMKERLLRLLSVQVLAIARADRYIRCCVH